MKNKIKLLALEVALGITVMIMFLCTKFTILNSVAAIRYLSIFYIVAALVLMVKIIEMIFAGDKEMDPAAGAVDKLSELFYICRSKGLAAYAETVQAQMQKLEKRISNLNRMLAENFGEGRRNNRHYRALQEYVLQKHRKNCKAG